MPFNSPDSGIFWFFEPENWEMQVKVLDACELNDRFWVFAAGTTDVEYTLRITDTATGTEKRYRNPLGRAAPAVTDTDAFDTCSAQPVENLRTTAGRDRSRDGAQRDVAQEAAEPALPLTAATAKRALDKNHGRPLIGLAGKCLNVEGGESRDGAPVQLFECHRRSNQQWTLEGVSPREIRDLSGRCLQPSSQSSRLVIGPCGGPEDRWHLLFHNYSGLFDLYHHSTGLCMDVVGANSADGTPVQLFECHSGANQNWRFGGDPCTPGYRRICLAQGHFEVEVEWHDFSGRRGAGRVVRTSSEHTGLFWFFQRDNWEIHVKVLDGCAINGHFWVFAGATTDVGYTLRVTNIATGVVREYVNPLGNAAPALTDTSAFATCDS